MTRPMLCAVILAAAPLAFAATGTVKVGKEVKKTIGIVKSAEAGDVACYVTLKDDAGKKFSELANFEICEMKNIIGKRVALTYELGKVMSDECQGDPECTKTRTVALIKTLKVIPASKPRPRP